ASMIPMRILAEGWRFVLHSYCLVSQSLMLEWLRRSDVELHHRDRPYFRAFWQPVRGNLSANEEAALQNLQQAQDDWSADVVVRFEVPFRLKPSPAAAQTWNWAATEYGVVQSELLELMGVQSLCDDPDGDVSWLTCSAWSRDGLVRSGVDPKRIQV